MSMDRCHECEIFVDTDEDVGCYSLIDENCNVTELDYCLCVTCREGKQV